MKTKKKVQTENYFHMSIKYTTISSISNTP